MPTMSESRRVRALSTWHIFGQRPAPAVALALLLAALLAAGCGPTASRVAQTSGTRTPATPTATLPPAPLSWETVNLPPGNLLPGLSNLGLLSVAPNDGNTAYACAAPTSLSVGATIWVTHDRGQHWTQLASLPVVSQRLVYCWIVPDAVDPAIAVAELSWPTNPFVEPAFMQGTHFVTFDGGELWQPLSGPKRFDVRWMATYRGTTIAAVEADVPFISALWVSHDQMQTWQSSTILTGYDSMSINPTTGELLQIGLFGGGSATTEQLEESEDAGQHWTLISTPLDSTTVVSPPVAGQPWRICGIAQYTDPNTGILMCSMDGGKTWTERPQYEIDGQFLLNEVAVGPDGTVYAEIGLIPGTLYRLAPGSDQWQSLSPTPQSQYAVAELPDAGIFWSSGTVGLRLYHS
jgi:hypothetical protein